MTAFEIALSQRDQGTPSVSMGNRSIDYFHYQLITHLFYLKIMASGMQIRGIGFKQIKHYYGLKGNSSKECVPQLEELLNNYKLNNLKG